MKWFSSKLKIIENLKWDPLNKTSFLIAGEKWKTSRLTTLTINGWVNVLSRSINRLWKWDRQFVIFVIISRTTIAFVSIRTGCFDQNFPVSVCKRQMKIIIRKKKWTFTACSILYFFGMMHLSNFRPVNGTNWIIFRKLRI